MPLHLLPRLCPLCRDDTIIGHGRRLRQARDDQHDRIWVRRGICRLCGKTFTVLPNWLPPAGQFSVPCRQQACERIVAGDTAEQAVPHCKNPSRSPDASTVRRWTRRRLLSLWCWARFRSQEFLQAPTIVAWDLPALYRILPFEARSP